MVDGIVLLGILLYKNIIFHTALTEHKTLKRMRFSIHFTAGKIVTYQATQLTPWCTSNKRTLMFDSVDRLTMTSPAPFVNLNLDTIRLWLIYHKRDFLLQRMLCAAFLL